MKTRTHLKTYKTYETDCPAPVACGMDVQGHVLSRGVRWK
jgi:hypothetical protein